MLRYFRLTYSLTDLASSKCYDLVSLAHYRQSLHVDALIEAERLARIVHGGTWFCLQLKLDVCGLPNQLEVFSKFPQVVHFWN